MDDRIGGLRLNVRTAAGAFRDPAQLRGIPAQVAVWVDQTGALVREGGGAPVLSVNRPVGTRRRLALARADLAATREVAHRHGGTVNDVVLAAMAGGARRLLEGRGELSQDLVVKVSVAASLRDPGDVGALGNRTGVRIVPLPLGEPDTIRVLQRVVAATTARRGRPPYQPSGRLLQRWMVGVMNRQRLVNFLLSNLHGPPEPLYFAGARMLELFQVGAVQGNLALGVCALSYAGALNLDVIADADVVPDVAAFATGLTDALEQLAIARPLDRGVHHLPGRRVSPRDRQDSLDAGQ